MTSRCLILIGSLLAFAAPPVSRAEQKPPASYPDSEAGKHVGEEATVTGKVFTVSKSAKGTTYLNLGDRFPRQTFSGVVLARDQDKVGDMKPFEGKPVAITGRIELSPDQKPQIVISSAEQIKLSEPGTTPQPPTPMPVPSSATVSIPPPPPVKPVPITPPSLPQVPSTSPPKPAETRRIALAATWNSPMQGGEMTRKDLALLFGGQGSASENTEADPSIIVYPDIPFLTPLAVARRRLNLEGSTPAKSKITCPGMPLASFSANTFGGIFAGGFSSLTLVTDTADQVVSVLLVDENTRQRTPDITDNSGYHTYNFINLRVKGTGGLVVKHQVAAGATPGVLVVDSVLIDPNAPDTTPKPRSTKSTFSKSTTSQPRTGKVLERSRWFVPVPIVNLILRCVGNR